MEHSARFILLRAIAYELTYAPGFPRPRVAREARVYSLTRGMVLINPTPTVSLVLNTPKYAPGCKELRRQC